MADVVSLFRDLASGKVSIIQREMQVQHLIQHDHVNGPAVLAGIILGKTWESWGFESLDHYLEALKVSDAMVQSAMQCITKYALSSNRPPLGE